jgi:AraC-like DNA-binding protein
MAGAEKVASNNSQVVHFSTDAFRSHERVDAWRETFGRALLNIDIFPKSQDGFHASASIFRSPMLSVLRASTSPVGQGNSRHLVTNDDVTFSRAISSSWAVSKLGRCVDLHPGDGVLLNNADVGSVEFPEESRYVSFKLPKSALASLLPDIGALYVRRVPASNPALHMLWRYIDLAQEDAISDDASLQCAFTSHVCDLLVLALGATRDAAQLALTRGVPAARLRAMKADIHKSYRNADFSVHTLAARHGISARHVQRAFEGSGSTFTQYVAEQRLMAAYKVLRYSAAAEVPISTIAYDCGFSDVSYFNQVFRRRFGCTPNDVRGTTRPTNLTPTR